MYYTLRRTQKLLGVIYFAWLSMTRIVEISRQNSPAIASASNIVIEVMHFHAIKLYILPSLLLSALFSRELSPFVVTDKSNSH